MTPTTLPDEILKTDVLGRVRTPKTRREALLAEFARSGVSGKNFAALVGVHYQTFASWVQHWRRQRAEYPSAAKGVEVLRLVEAVVEARGDGAGVLMGPDVLRVEVPGGARVEVGGGRLQRAARAGGGAPWRRPALGRALCLLQPAAHAAQDALLRWDRGGGGHYIQNK